MAKYEVIPTPDLNEDLLPGDEIWITYRLFQGGDWMVGYQVGQIERDIEADARFRLLSYHYDEQAMTLTLKCERRTQPAEAEIQLAGGFGWGVLAGLIAAGVAWIAYESGKRVQVMRDKAALKSVVDSPDTPPAVREAIERALDTAGDTSGPGAAQAVSDVAAAVGVVALAVLA